MTSISSIMAGMGLVSTLADKQGASSGTASSGATAQISQARPLSLVDYLNASDSGSMDIVSLSPQAQQLLATQSAGIGGTIVNADSDGGASARDGAIDFILTFFERSGIDVSKLSAEAKQFLANINDQIDNFGNATRDAAFDKSVQSHARSQRESYSLQGEGRRLTLTVQYEDGKPVGINFSSLSGQSSTTAALTFGTNDAGEASTMEVSRSAREYSTTGRRTSTVAMEPLSLALYAQAAAQTEA